ncbi:MocR-like pyridoxine biosynthesis transcription factor PdxR [Paenibacillus eucommiae]|uniref:GntR family transcriptional regulator/MocR family aminotransferase n=1 Tax=Paenibacillus eucommiae TaxID=1355755 RepID=A0ABS4IP60_9BACL|nr:PLP-dependent aminotransferase family protein [Paenibacillus eucommiae]MBP1988409.1 GntR family transcriptional regulator/MocR family aminotransferase [Paenibacillus eucommiae]
MIEITPLLDKLGKNPLFVQLYSYIKEKIEAGIIVRGTKLPSIRQLAEHLKISKNTVEAAYQQLLSEGYVESKGRVGFLVLPLEDMIQDSTSAASEAEPSASISTVVSSANSNANSNADSSPEKYKYDFRYGHIEIKRFPMAVWKSCLLDALHKESSGVLGYGDPLGEYELRVEISRYLFQSRGITCVPEQIFISSGTQQSVNFLCQLLPLRGQVVGIENPGYEGVRTVLKNNDCTIMPISLEADGLNIEELYNSNAKAVYVTPSHQFPLGMVLPIQKRMKLLQWANEHESLIIEDDYDSEFRYLGQPIPSLKALDSGDRVIYTGTFSKSFLPAARLSYTVLPAAIMDRIGSELQLYSQSVSPILQKAVFLFMNGGHFARHIRKMRRVYQGKHKVFIHAISRHLGTKVEIIGLKSGLHILLDVKGRTSEALIEEAKQRQIGVYSPKHHWLNPEECPRSYLILGFGGMEEVAIEEGIHLLKEAWGL